MGCGAYLGVGLAEGPSLPEPQPLMDGESDETLLSRRGPGQCPGPDEGECHGLTSMLVTLLEVGPDPRFKSRYPALCQGSRRGVGFARPTHISSPLAPRHKAPRCWGLLPDPEPRPKNFVRRHHSHHAPQVGEIFSIGVDVEGD